MLKSAPIGCRTWTLCNNIVKGMELLLSRDALYKEMHHQRPDCNARHVYLGELECQAMLDMKQAIEHVGSAPIALVYNGKLLANNGYIYIYIYIRNNFVGPCPSSRLDAAS